MVSTTIESEAGKVATDVVAPIAATQAIEAQAIKSPGVFTGQALDKQSGILGAVGGFLGKLLGAVGSLAIVGNAFEMLNRIGGAEPKKPKVSG